MRDLQELKRVCEANSWDVLKVMEAFKVSKSRAYGIMSDARKVMTQAQVQVQAPLVTEATESKIELNEEEFLRNLIPHDDGHKYDYRSEVDDSLELWAWKLNKPLCLVGEASGGKTYGARELAKRHRLPFLVIPGEDGGSGLREQLGFWKVSKGNMEWVKGALAIALRHPSVILFDEVGFMMQAKLGFLHELTQNRRVFVKDAPPEEAIINVHPECRIILAMNPSNEKYKGTNKLNCALATRVPVIYVPDWKTEDLKITCPHVKELKKFYNETRETIKKQGLRVVMCRRNLERMANALNNGASLRSAVVEGFINSALLTTDEEVKNGLYNLAVAIFGLENLEPVKEVKKEETIEKVVVP